jgi:hypothetical protein
MRLIKFLPLLFILTLLNSASFAETKKDCGSILKSDTGVKMYEKWKCKMGKDGDGDFVKKFKNLFKKKE